MHFVTNGCFNEFQRIVRAYNTNYTSSKQVIYHALLLLLPVINFNDPISF